ncbi:MAG TPA: NAD(P)-binding domain-containing protein [Anaerolineales bacterium]|nr:NAD(P)-binding domain-containing protein [Anaerolineales bacterium]
MRTGVLGSGMVGQAISARLAELGHDVMIGTRDPNKLSEWQASHQEVKIGSFAETAGHGEIIFNATNGAASLDVLKMADGSNLNGKVLIDISNALDFSNGMPPSLFVSNTDSLGEQIQRAFPQVKVVKTLNTVTANIMVNPRQVASGDHHVFVSGNDGQAKQQVIEILKSFGWIHILDLGDITTARGTEMYLPIWLRLWGALGTGMFNVRIMR